MRSRRSLLSPRSSRRRERSSPTGPADDHPDEFVLGRHATPARASSVTPPRLQRRSRAARDPAERTTRPPGNVHRHPADLTRRSAQWSFARQTFASPTRSSSTPPTGTSTSRSRRSASTAVAADGGIGAPVAISPKNGFCIDDSYIYDTTVPNAGTFIGTQGQLRRPEARCAADGRCGRRVRLPRPRSGDPVRRRARRDLLVPGDDGPEQRPRRGRRVEQRDRREGDDRGQHGDGRGRCSVPTRHRRPSRGGAARRQPRRRRRDAVREHVGRRTRRPCSSSPTATRWVRRTRLGELVLVPVQHAGPGRAGSTGSPRGRRTPQGRTNTTEAVPLLVNQRRAHPATVAAPWPSTGRVSRTGRGTVTAPPLAPGQTGDLLLAFVAADGPSSGQTTTVSRRRAVVVARAPGQHQPGRLGDLEGAGAGVDLRDHRHVDTGPVRLRPATRGHGIRERGRCRRVGRRQRRDRCAVGRT